MSQAGYVSLLLGKGDGTFLDHVDIAIGGYTRAVALGDFDVDGHLDIATGSSDDGFVGEVRLLLGKGDGTFGAPVTYQTFPTADSLAVGDINGDGKLDVVVDGTRTVKATSGNTQIGTVSVLIGNGDGTLEAPVDYTAGFGSISAALGDFNGDGKPDVVVANFGINTVNVLLDISP